MRVPRVYTAQPLAAGSNVALEANPSAHLARALRMGAGDPLTVFNGEGGEYAAIIASADRREVIVELGELRDRDCESPLAIELGIAASRGERMDWIVQKSTELGVAAITPLLTERVEVKLDGSRVHRFEAVYEPDSGDGTLAGDTYVENNRGSAFTVTPA